MGIHKGSNILNLGTLIKASIDEYNEIKNNNNNFNDLKKEEDNQIEEYEKKEKVLIIFDKLWILWLDPNINNSQNIKYKNEFKKIKNVNFNSFTETRECIEKINRIRYEKTFIIISGEILKDFYEEFVKIINEIEILPEILIFTNDERFIQIKKDLNNLKCSLFDVNSVFTSFDALEKRIKMKNSYISRIIKPIKIEDDEIFSFEYIKESKEQIFPLFLADHVEYPTKDEIFKFNKFLLDKFSSSKEFKLLIQQLFVNIKIPCEILIKYYLRAWTLESSFYKEMNYCLNRHLGKDYETYIKVVYHGLLNGCIHPANERKVFGGTRIKKIELDYIKNAFKNKKEGLPACICFNKAFLSSYSRENIALRFMIRLNKKENEEYVIFEIENGIESYDSQNVSNSNISYLKGKEKFYFFLFLLLK